LQIEGIFLSITKPSDYREELIIKFWRFGENNMMKPGAY